MNFCLVGSQERKVLEKYRGSRFFLMQSLATLRISELFDVIVDYPDSMPALADLKECLAHTHQHSDAVTSLAEAIDARLLKPGADTANIIQVGTRRRQRAQAPH